MNLNSIPLDAVERVEVLTDGASALYGADAIAGVVNFVLKKNLTEGSAYYNASIPGKSGGGAWNAGLSKGFGDLTSDGWNILFTFSHDVQDMTRSLAARTFRVEVRIFRFRPTALTTYSTRALPIPSPPTSSFLSSAASLYNSLLPRRMAIAPELKARSHRR